jgi:hypothetical protein
MNLLTDKITYEGVEVTDIFKRFKFLDRFKNSIRFYQDYYIRDNESPEHVALKFYGDVHWSWLVLLFNEILDPFFDWPISDEEIELWAQKLVPDYITNPSVYYAKIAELNTERETHRKIKILRSTYLSTVIKNLKELK